MRATAYLTGRARTSVALVPQLEPHTRASALYAPAVGHRVDQPQPMPAVCGIFVPYLRERTEAGVVDREAGAFAVVVDDQADPLVGPVLECVGDQLGDEQRRVVDAVRRRKLAHPPARVARSI